MNSTLQLRIDTKTKKSAAKIFESLGLDLSSGIKIYLSQVMRHKGIPFNILTENGFTDEQEKRLHDEIKHTDKMIKSGKVKIYDNWREAKKAILSE
jgi:DNA-damage-inducible protein J